MMKTLITSVLLIFTVATLHAQNKAADSLKLLLNEEKTDTGKVKLMIGIGSSFGYGYAKNDSALWYLNAALDLSNKINYQKEAISARESMGRYFYTSGNYKEALKLLLQNLKEQEQLRDTTGIYYTIKDLMKTYRILNDYNQEMEYAKKAKALLFSGYFKDSAQIYVLSTVYLNHMASVYEGLGKPDSSLYYWKLSYQNLLKENEAGGIAVGAGNLAGAYANLGKNDSAFYYYKESIPDAMKSKRFDIAAGDEFGIAQIFHKKNQSDSAFFYARKALKMFQKMDDPGVMDISSFLSQLYESNKQYDSAYKYLQSYVTMRDSFYNKTNISQAQNFSFNEKLQQQQLEQAKKEAQQQLKNQIKFYILAAALIIFSFVAFILYRNVRNKRKAYLLLNKQKEKIQKTLVELKSTQAQLIQSEKMASLGELTAGIAHEIQNPLNFVNNFSEVNKEMLEDLKAERLKPKAERDDILEDELINDVIDNSEKINHHGKRAGDIVKGMLQHSRATSGTKEPTDINALADEYLRLSYHGQRAKDKSFNAEIITDFDETIGKINIIPQDIGRVLLNLFNNAFYAVNEQKNRNLNLHKPTVSVTTKKSENSVLITVSDNGNGIPKNIVDKIFQPFFTTKPSGSGTGLGLSLSYDIVKAHGGEIKVASKEGEGTEFIIQLPITY